MEELKIGITGSGEILWNLIETIRRIPGTRIVALADKNKELLEKLSVQFGISHIYTDYSEMLDTEELNVLHNCAVPQDLLEINQDALARKISVFSEVPTGVCGQRIKELESLAFSNGVHYAVNFCYRYNAMVREMHERANRIDDNPFENWGRTFLVRGSYLTDKMMYEEDGEDETAQSLAGSMSKIENMALQWVDVAQYILDKKIVRVNAQLNAVFDKQNRLPDIADISLEFEGGIKGNLIVSRVTGGHKNDFQISVDGSNYSMTWRQERPDELYVGARKIGTIKKQVGPEVLQGNAAGYACTPTGFPDGWSDALKNCISSFYREIRDNNRERLDLPEASDSFCVWDACLKSNEKNSWIEV